MRGWPPAWPRCAIYLAQYPEVTSALPTFRCGNGGLDWARVKPMIEGPGGPLQQDSRVRSQVLSTSYLPHYNGLIRPGVRLDPRPPGVELLLRPSQALRSWIHFRLPPGQGSRLVIRWASPLNVLFLPRPAHGPADSSLGPVGDGHGPLPCIASASKLDGQPHRRIRTCTYGGVRGKASVCHTDCHFSGSRRRGPLHRATRSPSPDTSEQAGTLSDPPPSTTVL